MNLEELSKVRSVRRADPQVSVMDLTGPERTLLWGYDVDRIGFHVYLHEGLIHLVREHCGKIQSHVAAVQWAAHELAPNKRAFPERTDVQFATLMAERGAPVCFTTFAERTWADTKTHRFHAPIVGWTVCGKCGAPMQWDEEHSPPEWRHEGSTSRWCEGAEVIGHP